MDALARIPQLIVYGVVSGSVITLGAVGLSLSYGILRFGNFAHGDLMTLGAYFALVFLGVMRWVGMPEVPFGPLSFGPAMAVALVGAMGAAGGTAIIIDRLVYRRLRGARAVILLIASVGVTFLLRNLVLFAWGPDACYYTERIQRARLFWGIRIKPDQWFIVATAAVLVLLLHLFLTRTKMGKAMRATADNMELAKVTGIDTERVVRWVWGIGAALAAAGGVLAGIENKVVTPELGWQMLLPMFAAVILGGIGNPYGALAGGMIIGLSEEISTIFISASYKPAVAFGILVLMLILRPHGLFGRR